MIWTGLVTLLFVVVHVRKSSSAPGTRSATRRSAISTAPKSKFSRSPIWVGVYVICMIFVGFHLRHGIASAFQSLGADHPVYTKRLVRSARCAIVIAAASP